MRSAVWPTPQTALQAELSEKVPVWIACRSEMPHDIGQVWQYLPSFVRFPVSPLKKSETRILIAQAVTKRLIRSDAVSHLTALYRLSKGNPRLLEELLVELAARDYRMDTSFGQALLAIDQRIQAFETRLAADSTESQT